MISSVILPLGASSELGDGHCEVRALTMAGGGSDPRTGFRWAVEGPTPVRDCCGNAAASQASVSIPGGGRKMQASQLPGATPLCPLSTRSLPAHPKA